MRTPYILTMLFMDLLKQSRGSIVNVSCDKGSRPEAGQIGYGMAKAGMEMFTQASALELAPFGVRLNAVAPSFVDTNLYRTTNMSEPELIQHTKRVNANNPTQRSCTIPEVCKAIIFLTSQQ